MSGSRIDKAKDSLQLFLRSLPEKIKFNIINFNSSYYKLFDGKSLKLNEETLNKAIKFVDSLSATGKFI
jgi:hypothetical protein